MLDLPKNSKYLSRAQEPVDDAVRNDVTNQLNDYYAAGKINEESYLEQLDLIYQARVLGDLVPVVQKLPVKATYNVPEIVKDSNSVLPDNISHTSSNLNKISIYVVTAVLALIAVIAILLVIIFG